MTSLFSCGLIYLTAAAAIGLVAGVRFEDIEDKKSFFIKSLGLLFLAYLAFGIGYFILAPLIF